MAEQMNVDLGQSPFMISQPTATFNNNSIVVSNLGRAHQSLNNGSPNQLNGTSIARSYNSSKRTNVGNERTGGDGTFLTEVSINNPENYDNRIVYNNLIETPQPARQSPVFGKARIYPPIQDLANYMTALNRKVQLKKFTGILDQRNSLHQPIVVHSYKDSQFNNGLRKLPPPPRKDAFYPLKKLNKRKQIEELAAELSKKDNFEHDFSKHSINNEDDKVSVRSKHSSTGSKSKSLPPLNPTREQSDAISQAFSDLNPDASLELPTKEATNDDKFDTKSIFSSRSKYSQRSRKSKAPSELSFSIGSDAESDRIRQLEHSLKHEEEARRNILKILDEIQQKQEFLLNKLSEQEREQFESMYGRYSNLISDLKKNDDNISVALSVKDIQELKRQSDICDNSQGEHLPKLDKSEVHSTVSRKSVAKSDHSTAISHHSVLSRQSQALSLQSNHSQRSQALTHHSRQL
ncbi:hypothetical protein C9374_011526 [Naegleria lovaniensis]|uniref:Uncharacterized protein n=1 Tax=Naegleria lovaniensis TaxID=51637 RepID=A0AA88H4R6_NAELO|nr:uncharacterized protein C9374_014271 [Naegleria lovaniensis]XP_044554695.1 uncharacterized protein C9374_011526 [Naegleria lovaniensis]KAG2370748.1 hypothetical protein C9374_014271 [Naegleria lovaniensis]KAG2392801.1 hypothetical protein C9374_011526 [Naegleria lovaniensis]